MKKLFLSLIATLFFIFTTNSLSAQERTTIKKDTNKNKVPATTHPSPAIRKTMPFPDTPAIPPTIPDKQTMPQNPTMPQVPNNPPLPTPETPMPTKE